MRERGFDVAVMSSPGVALDRCAEEEGILAEPIQMERRITPVKDLVALFRMFLAFKRIRPTIVHASTPKGGLLGTIAGRISGVPIVVYHVRGLIFTGSTGVQRALLRTTERIACALAHRVVCVSSSVRTELINEKLCSPDKAIVLLSGSSNGVDAQGRFDPANRPPCERELLRDKLGIPTNASVAGFVGRLVRDKGIVELANAWEAVANSVPDAWLLVVGPWEPRDPVPADSRTRLEIHPRAILAGSQSDVAPFYSAMDLLVLPSYREGFPNVPLEAAAMRRPAIVAASTGCIDAVVDGVTGEIVPVRDAKALAEAMTSYLKNRDLRESHGAAAQQRALSEFQPQKIWEALRAEYVKLLRARGLAGSLAL